MNDTAMFSLIARLSKDLDSEGVVHALNASVAAGLYDEPVTSIDVDFVVKISPETAVRLWARDLHADEYGSTCLERRNPSGWLHLRMWS